MSYCDWSITIQGERHPFGEVQVAGWEIAGRDYRTDDTDRPRADGRYVGQDFSTPGDIEVDLLIRAPGKTNQEKFDNAWALREEFGRVWNGDAIRFTPGLVAELEVAGKAVVEGRPRSLDWDDSKAKFGIIKGNAVFVRTNEEVYAAGTGTQSVTVGLVPAQQGGLIAPLVAPLTTSRSSSRAAPFDVGGDATVWPVISLHGPINPGAEIELLFNWTVKINRGLKYDEVAVLDTRPGRRAMTLNGQPVNLIDPTGARLTQLSVPPGTHSLALRGTSLEGTAYVTLEWREGKKAL